MENISDGYRVVFEGIDATGKSTQIKLISERFKKYYNVVVTKEPQESTKQKLFENKEIEGDPDKSFELYLRDHIDLNDNYISKWLSEGNLIIQDRVLPYSHQCYWGDTNPHHNEIHDEVHIDCIEPDLTILLVIDPLLAVKRIKERDILRDKYKPWSNILSLKKIQNRYLELASRNKETFVVFIIDEQMSEGEISNYLMDIIKHRIKKHKEKIEE